MDREGVLQWLVGDHGSAPKANCPLCRVGPEEHHLVKSYPFVQHSQNKEESIYYNKYVIETNLRMLKILPALQQCRTFVL
jgi:hypothetical protein